MSAETVSVGAAGPAASAAPGGPGAVVRALHGGPGAPRRALPALDALTGLPNRVMLASWLAGRAEAAGPAHAGAPGGRIGLLSLDLDGFRQVNAMLGFGAGDRFLASVADRLTGVTAPGGHLLARTGGDEFAVLVNLSGPSAVPGRVPGFDESGLYSPGLLAAAMPALAAGPGLPTGSGLPAGPGGAAWGSAGVAEAARAGAVADPRTIRPGVLRPGITPAAPVTPATLATDSAPGTSGAPGDPGAARRAAPEPVVVTAAVATAVVADVADGILAALREPVVVDGRALTVTASIGAVQALAAGAVPEDLLRAADLALYWAKGDGRDRWTLFDPARGGADVARYRLAADLPAAVESGQFFCEYQPIVSLADGTVAGVEALVRWRHPRFGAVPPDRFIGLAEDSGLIVELGRRILAEACRAAAGWPDRPGQPAPPVSVNVAVRQMRDPGLAGHVLDALDASGLPPHRLRLEITESALLPGGDGAAAVLGALAEAGVGIAVDDFGAGYSNLAHLRRLPLDILKIDGAFVAGLLAGDRPGADEQIIASVTALGHGLGLSVTAEGVETAEQCQTVRRLGVDTGQGWYFSRALSADAIRDLLASGAPLAA